MAPVCDALLLAVLKVVHPAVSDCLVQRLMGERALCIVPRGHMNACTDIQMDL